MNKHNKTHARLCEAMAKNASTMYEIHPAHIDDESQKWLENATASEDLDSMSMYVDTMYCKGKDGTMIFEGFYIVTEIYERDTTNILQDIKIPMALRRLLSDIYDATIDQRDDHELLRIHISDVTMLPCKYLAVYDYEGEFDEDFWEKSQDDDE